MQKLFCYKLCNCQILLERRGNMVYVVARTSECTKEQLQLSIARRYWRFSSGKSHCSAWGASVGKTYRTFSGCRWWQAGLSSRGIIPDKTRALRRPSSPSSPISPRPVIRTSRTRSSRSTTARRRRRRAFAASHGNNMRQALSSISR